MSDWIGKTLGNVRLDLLLARGGMAEVYLGMHTTLNRQVAVKLLRNTYFEDQDLLAGDFQRRRVWSPTCAIRTSCRLMISKPSRASHT